MPTVPETEQLRVQAALRGFCTTHTIEPLLRQAVRNRSATGISLLVPTTTGTAAVLLLAGEAVPRFRSRSSASQARRPSRAGTAGAPQLCPESVPSRV
jgi:hypothetical protein